MLSQKKLTTVEILYRIPDYPELLQSFIWQDLDVPPQFPKLQRFLEFWEKNLDGKLHSVKLAYIDAANQIRLPNFCGNLF